MSKLSLNFSHRKFESLSDYIKFIINELLLTPFRIVRGHKLNFLKHFDLFLTHEGLFVQLFILE